MATLVATTSWSHTQAQGTSFSIPLNHAATAGNMLVVLAGGGAIVTVTGFTKRSTYGSGAQDVSLSDKVAAGGETTLSVTLNGADNVSGVVYEFGPGLTFSGWSNNGSGSTIAQSGDWQLAPAAATASSASVLVGLWTVATSTSWSVANQFRQMGPLGKLYASAGNQPGSFTQFIWASGVADITSTAQYPPQAAAGSYRATSDYLAGGTGFAVQGVYADTSGVATNPAPANAVVAENSLPGTDYGNWYVGTAGTDSTIAGYTDAPSYAPGSTVNFKVDSTGAPFRVEIYRLGWYGWETFGARNVLGNQGGYLAGTVVAQSAPTVDGTLGSTSCAWTTNATWTIPANAPSGVYYVLYRRTDLPSHVASDHFTVRGSVAGRPVVTIPDPTYRAYDIWGATTDHGLRSTGVWSGRSLYQAGTDGATPNINHRGYAGSFDHPRSVQSSQDPTYLTDSELGWLVWAEAQGYPLSYLSDMDLEGAPTALNTASLVIMLGHHEYLSKDMYDAYRNAIAAGANLHVDSSNTALWRVRFAAGDANHRTMICYKDSATADEGAGFTGTGFDPGGYTGTWRDSRVGGSVNNTDIRRENALTGQLFVASGPVQAAMSVPFASKGSPIWRNSATVQALTAGQSYQTTVQVLGYEVECADGSTGQPTNLVALNPFSASFTTLANGAGTIYSGSGSKTVGFTLYRASSGALVFNTGSWRGWWSVSRWRGSSAPTAASVDLDWQNALLAIMFDLGQVPVTLQSLKPGQDTAPTDPSVGAPTGTRNNVAVAYGLTVGGSGGFFAFFP